MRVKTNLKSGQSTRCSQTARQEQLEDFLKSLEQQTRQISDWALGGLKAPTRAVISLLDQ